MFTLQTSFKPLLLEEGGGGGEGRLVEVTSENSASGPVTEQTEQLQLQLFNFQRLRFGC
jgi:hypothetical protein